MHHITVNSLINASQHVFLSRRSYQKYPSFLVNFCVSRMKKYLPSQPQATSEWHQCWLMEFARKMWHRSACCAQGLYWDIPSWHQSVFQQWAVRIFTLWTQVLRLMGSTIMTHSWWRTCCHISSSHRRITSIFSRTVHQCTGRVNGTVSLLWWETPNFIPPDLWPLNSPDLNQVDNKNGGSCRTGLCLQDYQCWQTEAARLLWMGQDWSAADWQSHKTVA